MVNQKFRDASPLLIWECFHESNSSEVPRLFASIFSLPLSRQLSVKEEIGFLQFLTNVISSLGDALIRPQVTTVIYNI